MGLQRGLSGNLLPATPPPLCRALMPDVPTAPPTPAVTRFDSRAFASVPLAGIYRGDGKKQLITLITDSIAKHCQDFAANHREYATVNNYAYTCYTAPHWPAHAASFSKIWFIREALRDEATAVVIWADADVAFTNMTTDLAALLTTGYWLAGYMLRRRRDKSRPHICGGLLVILNVPHARVFFDTVLRSEPRWHTDNVVNKHHPWEEYYVDEELAACNFVGVRLCDTAMIGGFSRESWHDGSPWFLGCPTVHIARGGWAQRRSILLSKYLPQIKR